MVPLLNLINKYKFAKQQNCYSVHCWFYSILLSAFEIIDNEDFINNVIKVYLLKDT